MLNKLYSLLFSKENAEPLGFFRILAGICILITFLLDLPFVGDFYFNNGYVPLSLQQYAFGIFHYATPTIIYSAYALLLVSALFLTIGYKTRLASVITFVLILLFHERNTLLFTSGDSLLRILAFYLMISNSGAAYSVDSIIRKIKNREALLAPKWNRLLIKYQVSIFYFFAAIPKTGANWMNGTAIYYALNNPNFARILMPWLQSVPILVKMITWGALAIEYATPFLLWIPRAHLLAISLVTALQLGIFFTMNIGMFQITSIVAVLIFLEKTDIDRFWKWLGGKKQYAVVYDGSCELCNACVKAIQAMNVMDKLTFADFRKEKYTPDMEKQIWLVGDKTWKGFYAFRKMACLLPAFWIIVPLLYLPFAGKIGTAAYDYVACRRFGYCRPQRL